MNVNHCRVYTLYCSSKKYIILITDTMQVKFLKTLLFQSHARTQVALFIQMDLGYDYVVHSNFLVL